MGRGLAHPRGRAELAHAQPSLPSPLCHSGEAVGAGCERRLSARREGTTGEGAAALPRFPGRAGIQSAETTVRITCITPRSEYRRETVQLRGVRWVPLKMQPFAVGAVGYLHGVFESLYHAAMTAQHLGPRCGIRHLVSAHMHGWQSFTSPAGFTAYACPWLGDESAHVFRAYVKGKPRPWNLGLLYIEECGESVNVTPIFIRNGTALFGGRVVQAA